MSNQTVYVSCDYNDIYGVYTSKTAAMGAGGAVVVAIVLDSWTGDNPEPDTIVRRRYPPIITK